MLIEIVFLVIAIVMLFIGAELALDASEKVGKVFDIPPLVIGLVLIAMGTSLPEFFVSHLAAINNEGSMAIGNIVGSNIANMLLVLGISVLLHRISFSAKAVFNQVVIHFALSASLVTILMFNKLYTLSCIYLVTFFFGYLFYTYKDMKKSDKHIDLDEEDKSDINEILNTAKGKILLFAKLFVGFLFLYYGGEFLVTSGKEICRLANISEYMVSAIFIAFGTSFPELVTSLIATFKKKDVDLILGNVIGSNIFNVAFVMSSLAFYEIDLPRSYLPEQLVLLGASGLLLLFAYKKWPLGKLVGVIFSAAYIGITYYWVVAG